MLCCVMSVSLSYCSVPVSFSTNVSQQVEVYTHRTDIYWMFFLHFTPRDCHLCVMCFYNALTRLSGTNKMIHAVGNNTDITFFFFFFLNGFCFLFENEPKFLHCMCVILCTNCINEKVYSDPDKVGE